MLGPFDPSAFDAARPTAFYLEDEEDIIDSADSVWLCTGGVELPVHSQVVNLRSPVLREAYRALREGGQAEAVVVFLRFLYHPEAVTAFNLGSLGDLLPAVARLAHKFSVARVVACVEEWLMQPDQARTTEQLAMSLDLAERLQLDTLRGNTLLSIAKQLVWATDMPGGWSTWCSTIPAFIDVSQLGLGEGDRLRLLAVLAAAFRSIPIGLRQQCFPQLPGPDAMLELGRLQGRAGEFIWDVPGFTLDARPTINSPVFSVGGHRWYVHLVPHDTRKGAEAVSIYLFLSGFQEGDRGVEAAVRLTVVSNAGKSVSATSPANLFKAEGLGFTALSSRELVTNPVNGFLVNDTLRIKAEVVC